MQNAQPKKDAKPALPRVIAISSGKGGVGKSSICINLGISLAKSGARVCLLDADTGLANANILLGLTPQYTLEHVLYGAKPIEEVMLDAPHGLKIIPGANGISECVSLHPRQQLRLTRELARIESEFDFLLIDTAAGIAETTLDFVSASHHTVVVITPEPTSLTDAFSLIKLLKRRHSAIHYHVVVNMCSSASQAKEVFHRFSAAVEKYIGVHSHYLGHVLRDESMRAAVVLQNPVSMFPETDPSCRGFITLADQLDSATAEVPVSTSFSAYWHRQYREHRGDNGKPKTPAPAQGVSEEVTVEVRDSDYLSELRSRILLLIEQGHAEESLIQALLKESIEAFVERYGKLPVDVLMLVEQMVSSPERDDQQMRDIADKVKPWACMNNNLTGDALSLRDMADEDLSSEQPAVEPDSALESDSEPSLPETFELGEGSNKDEAPLERSAEHSDIEVVMDNSENSRLLSMSGKNGHHYDQSRFGSQSSLIEILRRQRHSNQPLAELLGTFL